jgi:hypothetical protein
MLTDNGFYGFFFLFERGAVFSKFSVFNFVPQPVFVYKSLSVAYNTHYIFDYMLQPLLGHSKYT